MFGIVLDFSNFDLRRRCTILNIAVKMQFAKLTFENEYFFKWLVLISFEMDFGIRKKNDHPFGEYLVLLFFFVYFQEPGSRFSKTAKVAKNTETVVMHGLKKR